MTNDIANNWCFKQRGKDFLERAVIITSHSLAESGEQGEGIIIILYQVDQQLPKEIQIQIVCLKCTTTAAANAAAAAIYYNYYWNRNLYVWSIILRHDLR